ncbi:hypothetical protein P8C59_006909 [Phyllachora maydis]|uniref:Uncharacterized protein n=1 Tax=Phyllachora maydis TaxID=1825666 RepID=A0AAD9I908_9PEZI|nr:hypothetical protein P8C59_006909 [Phyllachora maydis]
MAQGVILQQGRAKMRAYHVAERAAEQRRKAEEVQARIKAEADARRRAQADGYQFTELARVARERRVSAEMSLLASGVFDGLRDGRGAARRAVNEADGLEAHGSASKNETVRREGWKTRSLRERYVEAPRSRRSFSGGSSSVATDARGSSPFTWTKQATNFLRKRSAEVSTDDERQLSRQLYGAKRQAQPKTSGFQSQHWEMRARGFVPMPDGSWLPESIAQPMLEQGKRFAGIGDCGLGPGEEAAAAPMDGALEADDQVLSKKQVSAMSATLGSTWTHKSSDKPAGEQRASAFLKNISAPPLLLGRRPSPKRKRGNVEVDEDDDDNDDDDCLDAALLGHRSSFAAKKANTGSGSRPRDETEDSFVKTQRQLREIRENLDRLDRDEPWMQEQIKLMGSGRSVWEGS